MDFDAWSRSELTFHDYAYGSSKLAHRLPLTFPQDDVSGNRFLIPTANCSSQRQTVHPCAKSSVPAPNGLSQRQTVYPSAEFSIPASNATRCMTFCLSQRQRRRVGMQTQSITRHIVYPSAKFSIPAPNSPSQRQTRLVARHFAYPGVIDDPSACRRHPRGDGSFILRVRATRCTGNVSVQA